LLHQQAQETRRRLFDITPVIRNSHFTHLSSIMIPRHKISLILRLFSSTNTTQQQDTLPGKKIAQAISETGWWVSGIWLLTLMPKCRFRHTPEIGAKFLAPERAAKMR